MGIYQKLSDIQTQIKAPKNLYNSFGKYSYRNAEGICEAVKPYLINHKCALVLSDSIEQIGDRYYIAATARIIDYETNEETSVKAYAREALDKKGMDDSQISGTASSYARKYALNGLFLLDDTKDADTDEYHEQTNRDTSKKASAPARKQNSDQKADETPKKPEKTAKSFEDVIRSELKRTGVGMNGILRKYNVAGLSALTEEQAQDCIRKLGAMPNKPETA